MNFVAPEVGLPTKHSFISPPKGIRCGYAELGPEGGTRLRAVPPTAELEKNEVGEFFSMGVA